MRIVTTSAVALGAALLLGLAGTSPSFAKGHDQGFGNQTAGPATAGQVDNGVSNRGGGGRDSSYGANDVSPDARSGADTRDRSDEGQASGNGGGNNGGGRGESGR